MDDKQEQMVGELKDLSYINLKPTLERAIENLAPGQQKQLVKELSAAFGGLPNPTTKTTDWLWVIVVGAFAVVLVGGFVTLAFGMFSSVEQPTVQPETILATFTSVVGFLAGLFTPSPVADPKKG